VSAARRNGDVAFWYDALGFPPRRPALAGDRAADVCIVGAGYTGLWSAYYLKRARPDLEIVVLEREFAGFGASGRNGGWLSDHYSGSYAAIAQTHGRDAVLALRAAMRGAIDEVIAVARREGIDADIVKAGEVKVARSAAQVARLEAELAADAVWGSDLVALERAALEQRIHVAGARAGAFNPHCARVQPAKLVQGLARAVEALGVTIHESTAVDSVQPGAAISDRGTVRAPTVLTCLEGFTASLAGHRRDWLALNSAMVATAPLDEAAWARIGWDAPALLGDEAHAYIYAQRTADGRIAFGGRGVPYRFGSRTDDHGRTQVATVRQLAELLHAFFPAVAETPIDHAWCGVLGVPRDWSPTVRLNRATGLGIAGGYVGNGVSTTNLAGRTLADLVLGHDSDLTRLPWVGRTARRWEPEPLRWLGAHLVYGLYRAADRRESARDEARPSRLAGVADLLSGR
jgi:glycine/D-amino acid oxidase-like deaminating enzyme